MKKAEIDAIWAKNPETVFFIHQRYGRGIYARIAEKKGHKYVLDLATTNFPDSFRGVENYVKSNPDTPPEYKVWRSSRSEGWSCKDLDCLAGATFTGFTLETVARIMTDKVRREWQAEKDRQAVKPQAIADLLTLTNLRERDLQATPEAVLLALRDALTVKVGV